MAHTYTTIRLHLVFSTLGRKPLIPPDLQPRLWDYIGGIGKNHHIPVHAVGGVENHVHVLLSLPPTIPLSKAAQTIKAYSSKWINETGLRRGTRFAWQEGYSAFSVSQSSMPKVEAYIGSQAEHHHRHSFEDELRSLLARHGVQFDERFVFG